MRREAEISVRLAIRLEVEGACRAELLGALAQLRNRPAMQELDEGE